LKPRPTRAQFERDFVNAEVPADALEIARRNNDEATRKALLMSLPADGQEAYKVQVPTTGPAILLCRATTADKSFQPGRMG
jgi:hypothetical protein